MQKQMSSGSVPFFHCNFYFLRL